VSYRRLRVAKAVVDPGGLFRAIHPPTPAVAGDPEASADRADRLLRRGRPMT
jgi:hypothetical protein